MDLDWVCPVCGKEAPQISFVRSEEVVLSKDCICKRFKSYFWPSNKLNDLRYIHDHASQLAWHDWPEYINERGNVSFWAGKQVPFPIRSFLPRVCDKEEVCHQGNAGGWLSYGQGPDWEIPKIWDCASMLRVWSAL